MSCLTNVWSEIKSRPAKLFFMQTDRTCELTAVVGVKYVSCENDMKEKKEILGKC